MPRSTSVWLLALLVGLVATLPVLHFGAARPLSMSIAGLGVILCVALCASVPSAREGLIDAAAAFWPFLAAIAVFGIAAILMAPAVSVEPGRAYDALLPAALLLIAIPAAALASAGGGTLVLAIVLAGCVASAAFGLGVLWLGADRLVFATKTDYLEWVTGPFVNRNAMASYAIVGLLACLAIWRTTSRVPALFLAFAAGVLAVALAMTGSRAGIVLALAGAAIVGISVTGRRRWYALAGLVALLPGVAIVLARRADTALDSNLARIDLWRDAMAAIAARPLMGWGAGTYPVVSVLERGDAVVPGFTWDSSHNLYLDGAATMGIPLMLVVLTLAGMGIVVLLRSSSPAGTIGALAIALLSLHAVVDFAPATPAVLLAAAALVGVCSLPARKVA